MWNHYGNMQKCIHARGLGDLHNHLKYKVEQGIRNRETSTEVSVGSELGWVICHSQLIG